MVARRTKGTAGFEKNQKKEKVFKELVALVGEAGYVVRREVLKQGLGWRALSGSCRAESNRIIFVDRRLPQNDQISFLLSKIAAVGMSFNPEQLARLPEEIRSHPSFQP